MVSILIDDDLLLRTYQPDDAACLFRVVDENRTHLRTWLQWVDGTRKQEHSLQFIQQSIAQQNAQEALALGIFHQQDIIGGIGMHDWNQHLKKAAIGYWIAKSYEGKGIITRCCTRFLDFLFDKLQLNKAELHFVPQNERSAAVARRLGFTLEGIIRQSHERNGTLEDIAITGLLRTEWKQSSVSSA